MFLTSSLFLSSIIVALAGFIWLLTGKSTSKFDWFIRNCAIVLSVFFLFLMLHWELISFYLRYVIAVLFIILIIRSYYKVKKHPFFVKRNVSEWIISALCIIITVVFGYQILTFFRGYSYEEKPVSLAFPLKHGTYTIFWGGNGKTSPLMNYHYTGSIAANMGVGASSKYATDITEINAWGKNSAFFSPKQKELNYYTIFGETVYSPCDGLICAVINGWSDEIPSENGGNSILIKSDGVYIFMCHFKKDSITVEVGKRIKKGDVIGEVGCSGNAGSPHLHIEGRSGPNWGSGGVPILFDGRFPVKNSLFIR